MPCEDALVSALVHALARDRSPEARHRAVAALREARGVSNSRAYAILVRATAGLPVDSLETQTSEPVLKAQPHPTASQPPLLAS